ETALRQLWTWWTTRDIWQSSSTQRRGCYPSSLSRPAVDRPVRAMAQCTQALVVPPPRRAATCRPRSHQVRSRLCDSDSGNRYADFDGGSREAASLAFEHQLSLGELK